MAAPHDIPELDASGLRGFALTTSAILSALFGLLIPWVFDFPFPAWPWVVAAVLASWGLAAPTTLRPVYRGWMRFGSVMSRITTPLILGIIFYLVITPVAVFFRITGRNAMPGTFDSEATTYRMTRAKAQREKMERPF